MTRTLLKIPETKTKLERTRYQKLVDTITAIYEGARRALAAAYWQIGRRIVEVEQGGKVHAPYGKGLLAALSKDLSGKLGRGFSVNNLERMRMFYLRYPKSPTPGILTWSQQAEILLLDDPKERRRLEQKAKAEGLTSRKIRTLVQHAEATSKGASVKQNQPPPKLLTPKLGVPNTYRIKSAKDWGWSTEKTPLLMDRGFKGYRSLTAEEHQNFKAGDIVELIEDRLVKSSRTDKDIFTYNARLEKVVDGDTLWVILDLGKPEISRQKLRLRGIDAPEIKTRKGVTAKKFLEELFTNRRGAIHGAQKGALREGAINRAPTLTVRSHKNDKYDRYEADLFIEQSDGSRVYVNNLLLESGHAVRADA